MALRKHWAHLPVGMACALVGLGCEPRSQALRPLRRITKILWRLLQVCAGAGVCQPRARAAGVCQPRARAACERRVSCWGAQLKFQGAGRVLRAVRVRCSAPFSGVKTVYLLISTVRRIVAPACVFACNLRYVVYLWFTANSFCEFYRIISTCQSISTFTPPPPRNLAYELGFYVIRARGVGNNFENFCKFLPYFYDILGSFAHYFGRFFWDLIVK